MASLNTRRHRRQSELSTPDKYRLVITWPGQDRPRHFVTSDLARAKAIARRNAEAGAHVAFQEHHGWGRHTTTRIYTPKDPQ